MTASPPAGDRLQVLRDNEACCYMVRYVSGPKRHQVLDLFETDTLPLPWTAEASEEDVLADVRRRNPKSAVEKGDL